MLVRMKTWFSRLIAARGTKPFRLDLKTLPAARQRDIGLMDGREPRVGE